jgi:hypothetical protein
MQHRQEAEVATAEEFERAAAETTATTARAARPAMVKLAAARAKVEAAAAEDAARAAAVELEALRASSTGSSVSTDDDRDNELKLAREPAREQATKWAAVHPQGRCGGSPDGQGRAGGSLGGVHAAAVFSTAVATQTGADAPAAGLMEITTFTGGAALPSRTGTMVTMGSRPLLGTSSRRRVAYPHQDQLRRVGRGDEGTTPGAAHAGGSSIRRRRLL